MTGQAMTTEQAINTHGLVVSNVPICKDHDEDCEQVRSKLDCWLYDPARGFCPYLKTNTEETA